MSSILGVFSAAGRVGDPRQVGRMLNAMANRGADCSSVRSVRSGTIAAARHEWELDATHSGPVLVAQAGHVAVAADASLFYRDDLARKLRYRGATSSGDTPSHLILAAYQAWGADCVRELEGDFAFVVWDEPAHSVFAARDFAGKRPLYYSEAGDTLLIASSIAGLQAHGACTMELDLAVLAEDVAVLAGTASATCWRGIYRVPPGHYLQWRAGQVARLVPYWQIPEFADRAGPLSFDDAAEELASLLSAAVEERLANVGSTAIFLSGGWDSPALYATGQHLLCDSRDERRSLKPVSVSFPEGDPGREDDVISSIVGYWEDRTKWVRSAETPPLAGIFERAARRDEPFPHLFEMMNRALARTGRSLGARVVLDGNGGDQLFQASSAYLTDLFAGGRWRTFASEWRARGGGGGWRELLRHTLLPSLPASMLHRIAEARGGKPLISTIERPLPTWIRAPFASEHSLLEREHRNVPKRNGRSRAAYETAWQLTRPLVGRMTAALGTFALEEGVEHRSPFTDARVLSFAATRPVSERRSGGETKRLLRRAMNGLLPDTVLAPRSHRTGSPIRYLTSAIVAAMPSLIQQTMRDPVLGDLGIIDPHAFRNAWDDCVKRDDLNLCISLYLTMEVELWLRARAAHTGRSGSAPLEGDSRLAVIG